MYDEQLSPGGLPDPGRVLAREVDLDTNQQHNPALYYPSPTSIIDFSSKLWWDTLLNQYSATSEQS